MTDVSAGFRPPCWCPSRWAPAWRLHTNRYKFGENVSSHIFHKKNCCYLNLGESLCISTFFLFPDSGLNLLNGFDFLFWSILNGVTLKTSNNKNEKPKDAGQFLTFPSKSFVKRDAGGKKGELSCCKCLLSRVELIWSISSLKSPKYPKYAFLAKSSGVNGLVYFSPLPTRLECTCSWILKGIRLFPLGS